MIACVSGSPAPGAISELITVPPRATEHSEGASPRLSLAADKIQRLLRERQPLFSVLRIERDPLLHHATVAAWIEALAGSRRNQRIHARLGQLEDELAAGEHGEDLVVHLQRGG